MDDPRQPQVGDPRSTPAQPQVSLSAGGAHPQKMDGDYSERTVKGHVVGVERLERLRWRVTVDGRRLSIFCTEARARQAGVLEARRLDYLANDPHRARPAR